MERGNGADLRERAFAFACGVIALHRWIYERKPSLIRSNRLSALIAESTEIIAILTTHVRESRERA